MTFIDYNKERVASGLKDREIFLRTAANACHYLGELKKAHSASEYALLQAKERLYQTKDHEAACLNLQSMVADHLSDDVLKLACGAHAAHQVCIEQHDRAKEENRKAKEKLDKEREDCCKMVASALCMAFHARREAEALRVQTTRAEVGSLRSS